MKFEEAIKYLLTPQSRITRENWRYNLYFCRNTGYLMIRDDRGEISPYTICDYDFNYEWDKPE